MVEDLGHTGIRLQVLPPKRAPDLISPLTCRTASHTTREGAVRAWIEVGTRRTQCLLQAHAPPLGLSRDPGRAPDGVRQPELAAPRRDDRRDGANVPQDVLHKVVSVAYGAGRCERSRIAVAPTGRLADRRPACKTQHVT